MKSTIVNSVADNANRCPDRPALVAGAQSFTYLELMTRVQRAAVWLRSEQVEPGDRVVIPAGPGDPWFVVAYLASHLAGAIAVPVDSRISSRMRSEVIAQALPSLELGDETLTRLRQAIDQPAARTQWAHDFDPDEDAIADLLFTSGSTGRPKGVALSHRNVMAATRNTISFIGNDQSDREVVTVPLSHSFGLGRMRCTFHAGGTLILVPGLNFPALVFRALEEQGATGLSCVPAGVAILLKQGEDRLARFADRLRYMELGSAPMDAGMKRQLAEVLPRTRVCMHYGLTEASRSAFMEFHADRLRLDSVGRSTQGVRIRIVAADDNSALPGQIGRIQVSSDTVMSHYWNDEERTRQAFRPDGWFDTGDLGYLDSDDYLYLAGRTDDVINVGGKKVYPMGVEEVVSGFPGVAECGCAGVPDPEGIVGETPALWIVETWPGAVDNGALLKTLGRELEPHAMPRHVFKVGKLPRTDSGKLQRALLRAEATRPVDGNAVQPDTIDR